MKKGLLILTLLLITSFSFAQKDFLAGKWKYEKIPDHIEIDEQGLKMANEFFKDMTLSFDQNNYTQIVMGKSESGTWSLISESTYEFSSSKGYKYEVIIKKISKNQIIFKQKNREWQLIKSDQKAAIEIQQNSLDKIEGLKIVAKNLLGKWFYNGRIKDGKESGVILKHNKDEVVNYEFKKDGMFINNAPLDIELIGIWKIEKDKKTLVIESENKTEFIKIVKLDGKELHLYNPKNESILKFKKNEN
ncbi:hypothetical protein [Aquimarina sp. Aq107]|uniref:hypothetical protein n=1 Tax=Aquimarina sp. Aq107 TaxID=1191912 RepID=UPI000D54C8E5|nr:hypothetical protein [Aquimarina sp. Aq107]